MATIYMATPYMNASPGPPHAHDRTEARKRRVSHPLAARARIPARLRSEPVDRVALRRRAALPRRLAVPDALSHGASRMDRGALGGEGRAAAAALLPHHSGWEEGAHGAAAQLAGVRAGHRPDRGGGVCVTGAVKCAGSSCSR